MRYRRDADGGRPGRSHSKGIAHTAWITAHARVCRARRYTVDGRISRTGRSSHRCTYDALSRCRSRYSHDHGECEGKFACGIEHEKLHLLQSAFEMRELNLERVAPGTTKLHFIGAIGIIRRRSTRTQAAKLGTCACRKSNSHIQMMKSAKKWRRQNATNGMYGSRPRRVLVE